MNFEGDPPPPPFFSTFMMFVGGKKHFLLFLELDVSVGFITPGCHFCCFVFLLARI